MSHPEVPRSQGRHAGRHALTDPGADTVRPEALEHASLEQVIGRSGPMAPRRAAALGLAVLDQLVAVHNRGMLHGDVRPGSVLIGPRDRITLAAPTLRSPAFTAPEGVTGPAADLWSLGATLYTAVEGRPPGPGGPLGNAGPIAPILLALLALEPGQRPEPGTLRNALLAASRDRGESYTPLPPVPADALPPPSRRTSSAPFPQVFPSAPSPASPSAPPASFPPGPAAAAPPPPERSAPPPWSRTTHPLDTFISGSSAPSGTRPFGPPSAGADPADPAPPPHHGRLDHPDHPGGGGAAGAGLPITPPPPAPPSPGPPSATPPFPAADRTGSPPADPFRGEPPWARPPRAESSWAESPREDPSRTENHFSEKVFPRAASVPQDVLFGQTGVPASPAYGQTAAPPPTAPTPPQGSPAAPSPPSPATSAPPDPASAGPADAVPPPHGPAHPRGHESRHEPPREPPYGPPHEPSRGLSHESPHEAAPPPPAAVSADSTSRALVPLSGGPKDTSPGSQARTGPTERSGGRSQGVFVPRSVVGLTCGLLAAMAVTIGVLLAPMIGRSGGDDQEASATPAAGAKGRFASAPRACGLLDEGQAQELVPGFRSSEVESSVCNWLNRHDWRMPNPEKFDLQVRLVAQKRNGSEIERAKEYLSGKKKDLATGGTFATPRPAPPRNLKGIGEDAFMMGAYNKFNIYNGAYKVTVVFRISNLIAEVEYLRGGVTEDSDGVITQNATKAARWVAQALKARG
ncbi:hypothetical protein GCM10017673_18110 [Streptosporangium violaceochromogenes]|nr:hypothetical protein GCM10017673_18110 [Streptosporangium violaceochromogenes]